MTMTNGQPNKGPRPSNAVTTTKSLGNKIVCGPNHITLDLAGHTFAEIAEALGEVMNLDPSADAYVEGMLVEDMETTFLNGGQSVEFVPKKGKKGWGATCTEQEFKKLMVVVSDEEWAAIMAMKPRIIKCENGEYLYAELVRRLEKVRATQGYVPPITDRERPHFDTTRKLTVGDKLIKQLKKPAPDQTLILRGFEELGWPKRIDDPLPDHPPIPKKTRLARTIDSLNQSHVTKNIIRFRGDGTGTGIMWELIEKK